MARAAALATLLLVSCADAAAFTIPHGDATRVWPGGWVAANRVSGAPPALDAVAPRLKAFFEARKARQSPHWPPAFGAVPPRRDLSEGYVASRLRAKTQERAENSENETSRTAPRSLPAGSNAAPLPSATAVAAGAAPQWKPPAGYVPDRLKANTGDASAAPKASAPTVSASPTAGAPSGGAARRWEPPTGYVPASRRTRKEEPLEADAATSAGDDAAAGTPQAPADTQGGFILRESLRVPWTAGAQGFQPQVRAHARPLHARTRERALSAACRSPPHVFPPPPPPAGVGREGPCGRRQSGGRGGGRGNSHEAGGCGWR